VRTAHSKAQGSGRRARARAYRDTPVASAVDHLIDADLVGAPPIEQVIEAFKGADADVGRDHLTAHNTIVPCLKAL
jgi:hypothetical protein